jgi:hypothetical protein
MLLTHQNIIRNALDSLGFGDIWNGHITTTDPVGKFTIYHMHMHKLARVGVTHAFKLKSIHPTSLGSFNL